MNIFLFALIISLGINIIMFIPAFIYKTDKITDISYAVTFGVVAVAGYLRSDRTPLHTAILIAVLAWAFRLGTFLFIRINKIGKDVRFDGMRDKFFAFLRFWLLQGATVFVVMLGAVSAYSRNNASISAAVIVGLAIFALGLLIEAVADAQKFRFGSDPKNKGTWIDVGIWRASRHPNYLGEMMVWIGMFVAVFSSLSTMGRLVAVISPLYIVSLLLFVSGVPLLEASAEKKWGTLKDYRAYKKLVPSLIPSIGSIRRAIRG